MRSGHGNQSRLQCCQEIIFSNAPSTAHSFLVNDEGVSDNGAAEKQTVLILFNPLETRTVSPFGDLLSVHFNEL